MHKKDINNSSQNILSPTMEDYLEAIFNLAKEKGAVRVRDIANRLGVKMPAVSNMLKTLGKRGLIKYEKYEYLELTGKGSDIGGYIHERHQILRRFLTDVLKVDFDQADEDAYRMGHAVSPPTLERFVDFMIFMKHCSPGSNDCLEHFGQYRDHGQSKDKGLKQRVEKFAHGNNAQIKETGMGRER